MYIFINRQTLSKLQRNKHIVIILTLALSLLSVSSSLFSQNSYFEHEHFTKEDGLTDTRVYMCIKLEDKKLGILTNQSIDVFDGTNFSKLVHTDSLGFFPTTIIKTTTGNIIAVEYKIQLDKTIDKSISNISLINVNTGDIDHNVFKSDNESNNESDNKSNQIKWLISDSKNNLLLSTEKGEHYVEINDSFVRLDSIPHSYTSLTEYNTEYILGNTDKGISKYTFKDKIEQLILPQYSIESSIIDPISGAIYMQTIPHGSVEYSNWNYVYLNERTKLIKIDNNGYFRKPILWDERYIYPVNKKLQYYSCETNEVYDCDSKFPMHIENLAPEYIIKDSTNNIWVSSYYGLYKFSSKSNPFNKSIKRSGMSFKTIYQNDDKIIGSTFQGQVEIEIDGEGSDINITKENNYIVSDYINISDTHISINSSGQITITDAKGNIISTKKVYDNYEYDYDICLFEQLTDDKLLIANEKNGLFTYQLSNQISQLQNNIFENNNSSINDLVSGHDYMLATQDGLVIIDTANYTTKLYSEFGASYALALKDSLDNTYWHASSSGLYIIDANNYTGTLYYTFNNGQESVITDIIVHDDYLIMPSYRGLIVLNTIDKSIRKYTSADGLPDSEFNFFSSLVLNNNDIALGTISGLAIFSPDDICNFKKSNPIELELVKAIDYSPNNDVVTNFLLKKESIIFDHELIKKRLIFRHPDYSNIKGKTIRYCLTKNGEQCNTWSENDDLYVDLMRRNYGKFNLEIEVLNHSKNVLTRYNHLVIYKKPFTSTLIFYLLCCALLFGLVNLIVKYQKKRLRRRNVALEKIISERSSELLSQNKKLNEIRKSQNFLFSVIAHDLRSPLNTLRNLSSQVSYLINKNQSERIVEISDQLETKISHISTTVEDLLEWSILETDVKRFRSTEFDLDNMLSDLPKFFYSLLIKKNITIRNEIEEGIIISFDKNAFHSILRNLIGNAIKFSYPNTEITLKSYITDEYINIQFCNHGLPFSKNTYDAIIAKKAFKSLDGTDGEIGFGLGLQIINNYLSKNGGHLQLTQEDNPTVVTISIINTAQ